MKVAIAGGGFTGLVAAHQLSKAGHRVVVFEKNGFAGGLASGIKLSVSNYPREWGWDLERFYHHWFTNDGEIDWLVQKLGVKDRLLTLDPLTSIYYQNRSLPFDSPVTVLRFPYLGLVDRLRLGSAIAYLKFSPNWRKLEKTTAHKWWLKWTGEKAYSIVWEPLLKGKFGQDWYRQINMAWFWARIHKRTPKLRYFQGGFQPLITKLLENIEQQGGQVRLTAPVQEIVFDSNGPTLKNTFTIRYSEPLHDAQSKTLSEKFDRVIVTTPPATLTKLIPSLSVEYKARLNQLHTIGAYCLVLALSEPFLTDGTYWLNINQPDFPFLAVVEHTNFVDSKHYGNQNIVYIGSYLPPNHPHMQTSKSELISTLMPFLRKINPQFSQSGIQHSWLFKEPFAQPIVPIDHSKNILPLQTPVPGLILASMSQVYPWDRGTNYAIEMGKQAAQTIQT